MRLVLCAALATASPAMAAAPEASLASPDGSIRFVLATDGIAPPTYTVERRGAPVIAPSPLGLVFAGAASTGALVARNPRTSTVDRTLPLTATKAASARDRYRALTVELIDPAAPAAAPITLTVRAYDDAVAFRYTLPARSSPIAIANERSGFHLPAGGRCWGANVGRTTTSHEAEFEPFDPARVRPYNLYDPGLLCRSAAGTDLILAEADLDHYAGLYFRGREDGGAGFEAYLSPSQDDPRVAVRAPAGAPLSTPWRVMLMADHAGQLIASPTLGDLNPPAAGDWRWVRPGKAAWDWWSGPYVPRQPPRPMNMADLGRLIDFAGANHLAYMLIDEGWAKNSGSGGSSPADTDVTATKPGLDMPALVARAARQGVGLMVWVQWSQLDAQLEQALDRYVSWGLKGIKVDFMDRNDQAMVAFYHRVLAAAARRHLLVDLHGAYPPTGLNRTFPNYLTQEGVMGAEYNKWSRRVTATHNVSLAFTRMVLGPMDYTPGGFRNRTPADFRIVGSPPQVQTTRGQALAMYVVYESPLQMVADSPDAYQGAPELAFIADVPTAWDETRFLGGDVDSHVVLARRKGQDWYLGAMTNETGRTVAVPLSFLAPGRYRATVWQDGRQVTEVVRSDRDVTSADTLRLALAPSGGAAVVLRPAR